ncbi:hypothetical protein D9613_007679 [Agrocybe pediades]|uniref:C2H2-type domain-containing protein n=1 Tax=Agrocybe pediades TaxID=84607 RepID=A0A8H4QNH3_9AGAR|nr:hypothetical protein D9613_007679 [Agrocybe pediades]
MPRTAQPRDIPCRYCKAMFSKMYALNNHMRVHRRPKKNPPPPPPSPQPGHHLREETPPPLHFVQVPDNDGDATGGADGALDEGDLLRRQETIKRHPLLNGLPCDANGKFLPAGSPPPPWDHPPPDDFSPFQDRSSFELADLLFRRAQTSATTNNDLMHIWASRLGEDSDPPFRDTNDMYSTIDGIRVGDAPWQSFTISYDGDIPLGDKTPWKHKEYEVYFRDPRIVLEQQLANPDFATEMDFSPKQVFDECGTRRYCDFMSGEWAWRQANEIAKDPSTHGATFCPVILGSDKTTVSVATGQNDYYPLYMSNGLVHNNVRRAHRNAMSVIAFLAIPKTDKEHEDTDEFRTFRRHLFHRSLRQILESLRPGMEAPVVVRYADGHYRRTVFGLGPYIADYPEQVLLACIVQNWCPRCDAPWNQLDDGDGGRRAHELTEALFRGLGSKVLWDDYGIVDGILPFTHYFPRADIHELLSPDLLHQIIKGTFKDHLVTWVTEYIEATNQSQDAKRILADIDRRIAAAPSFPGLRWFPEGRGNVLRQQVYLPAIAGHVPPAIVKAVSSFLEFCYLVRRSVIDQDDLISIDAAVKKFHEYRIAFELVRPDGFSLPRQHSLVHYTHMIREFGAPNGLCSSITESKHIKAVKEPWRRSNHYNALGQMLVTNQRLDKLAAARVDFEARGMLAKPLFERAPGCAGSVHPLARTADEDDDGGEVDDPDVDSEVILSQRYVTGVPSKVNLLAQYYNIPLLPELLASFISRQLDLDHLPRVTGTVRVFPSAIATYYAPSDRSGVRGMFRERIRAVSSWRGGPGRYDTVFIVRDPSVDGFEGLLVGRVRLFMSVEHEKEKYPCALVSWYSTVGDTPCPETGMWVVEPDFDDDGQPLLEVVHLETILRSAHLMGKAGDKFIPRHLQFHNSLDAFKEYYHHTYHHVSTGKNKYQPPSYMLITSPAAVQSYHHQNDISSHHHMTRQPPLHMPSFQLPQLSPSANITITTMPAAATAAATLPNIDPLCHVTQQQPSSTNKGWMVLEGLVWRDEGEAGWSSWEASGYRLSYPWAWVW